MKKLQNNFTTPEQSKRLLELGVPADSADCIGVIHEHFFSKRGQKVPYTISILLGGDNYSYVIEPSTGCRIVGKPFPCWSVGRLMEVCKICEPKKDYEQLCEELMYCKDYCVLIISHTIANIPIIDFSKLEG